MKGILISRTDAIGDVVLTLPLCGLLKEKFPKAKLIFLGRTYTKAVVEVCEHVDFFWDWEEVKAWPFEQVKEHLTLYEVDTIAHVFAKKEIANWAKKVGIPNRLGSLRKWYHWTTCNFFVNYSRKSSALHEAQLNIKLFGKLGLEIPDREELWKYYGLVASKELAEDLENLLADKRRKIILHPLSKGSSIDWSVNNFKTLADNLSSDFQVFITGAPEEKEQVDKHFEGSSVVNLAGRLRLEELVSFISKVDVLVANSTGPLHIAAALGVSTVGLYPTQRPMHAGRWGAIGAGVSIISSAAMDELSVEEVEKMVRERIAE